MTNELWGGAALGISICLISLSIFSVCHMLITRAKTKRHGLILTLCGTVPYKQPSVMSATLLVEANLFQYVLIQRT